MGRPTVGEMCLTFISVAQPLQATSIVLASALRGAGDTRATLVVTFVGIWVVRVGVGYLLGIMLGLGLFGMWLAWYGDFIARGTDHAEISNGSVEGAARVTADCRPPTADNYLRSVVGRQRSFV